MEMSEGRGSCKEGVRGTGEAKRRGREDQPRRRRRTMKNDLRLQDGRIACLARWRDR